ncbi:MAG: divergent polysaccharide deacetylase family protein, partial [Campylobacterota bacterium]|nr:divergent polysaccharide deacetylase family protein [Campylobacterota bacterium]
KKLVNSSFLTYMAWGLAVIAVVLSSLIGGYYLGYEDAKQEILERSKLSKQKRLTMLKKLEDVSSKPKQNVNTRLKDILKKDVKTYTAASHEYSSPEALKPPTRIKRDIKRISSKPKLAIIIDDVCVKSHVKAIKRVGIPVTMSFLPPSKNRPNSAKLASNEKVYMVHLPLEAQSYSAEEPSTLRTDDSSAKITSRVQYIKKIFPRVSYVNNHTGSKFTSNELAVNRLIYALKKEKINFIDSRTTADTKVPMVMKNLGLNYVARDVFLDHYTDKKSIKKAIIKAIRIAKDHGTAVAIGHPHTNTLLALSESKKLFKDVELVYIDRLY